MNYTPDDERQHVPTNDSTWVEAWLFDVVQADASLAVSIELLLWPQRGRVAFHTSILRAGEKLISLVEADTAAPKPPSLEVRASGLWTDVAVQTPFDHMTVDIEAFAVELDSPEDVFSGAFGIRTPLGGELEWESAGDARQGPAAMSYEIPCVVHGELLAADETIEIDGWGWRSHRWGVPVEGDRSRTRGRTAVGEWFSSSHLGREFTMREMGSAPVTDPSRPARLDQHLAMNDEGDIAWVRKLSALGSDSGAAHR